MKNRKNCEKLDRAAPGSLFKISFGTIVEDHYTQIIPNFYASKSKNDEDIWKSRQNRKKVKNGFLGSVEKPNPQMQKILCVQGAPSDPLT